jgi:hypothetical protein
LRTTFIQQSKTVVTTAMLFATIIATTLIAINQLAYAQEEEQQESYTVQRTETSTQDPLPGHEAHQIVLAAPPREDGSIYSGVATFSASQPVEVVVLHGYNPSVVNQTAGEPLTAPFGDGQVAISLMKQFTDSPINAGSLAFTGNALAFHNLEGKPFSVTYTVDAEIKEAATTATTTTTTTEEEES